jgi:uncharacterized damage-inducible protein DinB
VRVLSEIDNFLSRIEDQRGLVRELIAGLPDEALNWRPIPKVEGEAFNSLGVMVTHIAGAEHFWIAEVVGKKPATRVRETEFLVQNAQEEPLLDLLNNAREETLEVFSVFNENTLDETRLVEGRSMREVTVRWALMHVVEHTALHIGHMQITRQLWREGQRMQESSTPT